MAVIATLHFCTSRNTTRQASGIFRGTFGTGAFPILTTDTQVPAVLAVGAGRFFRGTFGIGGFPILITDRQVPAVLAVGAGLSFAPSLVIVLWP